jgi:dihydrofolate reductase
MRSSREFTFPNSILIGWSVYHPDRMGSRACFRRLFAAAFTVTLVLGCLATPCLAAPWRFVVFSDTQAPTWTNQINEGILTELAQAITNERPAFVLFGGDMVNSPLPGTTESWIAFMDPVFQAGIPVFPAIGNHDADAVAEIVRLLGPGLPDNGPEGELDQTYAVLHENALVLVLNAMTYTNRLRINQGWVDAVLATNSRPHVFTLSHAPAFKVFHLDCLGTYPEDRNTLWASLRQANSRMYFSGHDHFYDHARIDDGDGDPGNDIHQFIVGTGGAAFYNDAPYDGDNLPYAPLRILHEQQYGYVRVEVDDYRVTATWCRRVAPGDYPPSSEVFSYVVHPELRLRGLGGNLALEWWGPALLQVASDVGGPFQDMPKASSPYALTNLAEPRLFYRLVVP